MATARWSTPRISRACSRPPPRSAGRSTSSPRRTTSAPTLALWGDPVEQLDVWQAHNPIDLAESLRGTTLYVSWGEGGQGPLDPEPVADDGEAFRALSNQAFVQRLEELGIPATIDDYGPGTHTWPYFERALHRSLPLLLEALGEPT